MHKRKKVGKIDKLMRGILQIQYLFDYMENIPRNVFWILALFTMILTGILVMADIIVIGYVLGCVLCIVCIFRLSSGWHSSVSKFLKMIFLNMVCIAFLMVSIISSFTNISNIKTLFIILAIIYFCLWILLSIIAKPKVARLANEVFSAVLSIVFTVGTYVMGIALPEHLPSEVIDSTYKSTEALEQIISQNEHAAVVLYQSFAYWILENLFLCLLPFICVTIISMTAISIKEYWLKKNPQYVEVWDSVNINEVDTENQ